MHIFSRSLVRRGLKIGREWVDLGNLATTIKASAGGLWFPSHDLFVPKHQNIFGVLRTPEATFVHPGSNIVTDAGDLYYAQRMAAESPTNAFNPAYMCSAGTPGKAADTDSFTGIANSNKTLSATYPLSDDSDVDNDGKGADIVTWKYEYAKTDFSAGVGVITHGLVCITNQVTLPASEALLTGWTFSEAFGKTVNDTLTIYVNHEALGQ